MGNSNSTSTRTTRQTAKKRRSDNTETTSHQQMAGTTGRGRRAAVPAEDLNKFSIITCGNWFKRFQDPDESEDTIGPEGIEKFCQEVGLDLEGITVLIIAWKLEARRMGYFTKAEWINGMQKLNVDSSEKLKLQFPVLNKVVSDPYQFKEMYKWAFGFAKDQDQKCMNVEGMWKLLLPADRFAHAETFLEFLEECNPVKVINRDQWMSFLEFSTTVKQDLANYDEMSAWPVLFDEYVAWKKDKICT
ncbi:DCN1-like protein 4 [Quaeritorhiza haematococci]|nr:DCN1-like protein 4 [Quaeritorhiza haematococci]